MTEEFQAEIGELAARHKDTEARYVERAQQQKVARQAMEEKMRTLFGDMAQAMVSADDHLDHDDSIEGTAGLAVSYNKRTNATRPTFHATAVCNPDSVDVNVSDGHWAQVPGTLGAWADWTDEQKVYSGPYDPAAIRQAVEPAFLKWYKRAMKVPDEQPPKQ